MLFNSIAVFTAQNTVQQNCFVVTEADRVTYIGNNKPEKYFGREYDGRGKLLLPAFFNAHSHLTMNPMRGFGENLPYAACGTDVCLTMVDGKVLYEDGEYPTIDVERVTWQVEQICQRSGQKINN